MNTQFSIPGVLADMNEQASSSSGFSGTHSSERLSFLLSSSLLRGPDGQVEGIEIRLDRGSSMGHIPVNICLPPNMKVSGGAASVTTCLGSGIGGGGGAVPSPSSSSTASGFSNVSSP